MAKIAILFPKENMMERARNILKEDNLFQQEIIQMKVIKTEDTILHARKAIDAGAHIIIARGVQAKMIEEHTKIPVVELVMTTQEMGLLLLEAKKILKKEKPKISMVVFKNMIGDTTYINELFDVDFRVYYSERMSDMESLVQMAVKDGAELIIGGERVQQIVKQYSIPSLFFESTEDSIRNAFDIAKKMSYTADVEKKCNAQVETILDTAFNGVIKIDKEKNILLINRMMEELFCQSLSQVSGKKIGELLHVEDEFIDRVMEGKQESCLTSVVVRDTPLMVMIAPIQFEEEITGAIVSCHKLKNVISPQIQTFQEMYLSGYIAKGDFDRFYSKDKKMKEIINLGKRYALSKFPVLIYGEDELESSQFAQSIHNNSLRKNSPFVSINCAYLDEKEQIQTFFGTANHKEKQSNGIMETAKYGTIYVREIDKMTLACQYQIFKSIHRHSLQINDVDRIKQFDIRLIVSSKVDLAKLVKEGKFREDLYYAINALVLKIPPLRERPNDIEYLVKQCLKNFKETYTRYLVLTEGAINKMLEYSWRGSVNQIESFCERLFLSATKKNVDEVAVTQLLEELYPEYENIEGEEKVVIYKQPEAEELMQLLTKYGGKRSLVAKELGISTTTLWRKMKKYAITDQYFQ